MAPLRYVYRALKCRYRDHRVEMDALLSQLRQGELAVDVGANKGAFLWALARRVGPQGRVLAVEPQPALAVYLRQTMARLALGQVEVVEAAASDIGGTALLRVPPEGSSPGASLLSGAHVPAEWRSIEVRAERLDTMLAAEPRRLGALKVDVEGFEAEVLKGAEALIDRHRPAIVVECEERHLESAGARCVRDVLDWLTARGYAVSLVERHRLVDARFYSPDRHQRRAGERYWDHPDYCNNFVALPRR
jgi:FkbM family methyltransferase